MKRPRPAFFILFIVLSLVIGSAVFIFYRIGRVSASFGPPEIDLEKNASPFSDRLAKKLLEHLGYPVKSFGFRYKRDDYSLVIRRYSEDDDWEEWREWLEGGRRLVLLADTDSRQRAIIPVASANPLLEGVETLCLDSDVTLEDFDFPFDNTARAWLVTVKGRPLVMHDAVGDGDVIYIADGSIWSDVAVIRGDNGFLLNNCLKSSFPETVVFDERMTAEKLLFDDDATEETPFFLLQGRFLPLFLQLIFLGIIFCLVFWKRFGPPRDLEQFSKRSLFRHLSATGNFFEKTRNPRVFADILDRFFFSRLRDLVRTTGVSADDLKISVKKRLNLTPPEEDAFSVSISKDLVARDDRREQIILRLKGVEHHHGKNKNAG